MGSRDESYSQEGRLAVGLDAACHRGGVIIASKALSGIGLPVAIIMYEERLDVWAPGAYGHFPWQSAGFRHGR
jgi:hypothetical protein